MEVVEVNNSGLFEVRLGGVALTNCSSDADCPGRAYCARNASWSIHPSMCYCDFVYGYTGPTCDQCKFYMLLFEYYPKTKGN